MNKTVQTNNRDQFEKVTTGNGFANDLVATTNDRLELTVLELQNLQKNNSLQTDKLSGLLESLDDNIAYINPTLARLIYTIETANKKNDRLQRWFFILAIIGTVFTALSVIQVIDILIRGIGK